MNDLTFIETQLKNPSLKRRRDFIEAYDFPEQYDYFYRRYIRDNLQQAPKDNWYLIALIELAKDIHFFDADMPSLLWQLYEQRSAAVYLKLTILDYFLIYPIVSDDSANWEKDYLKHLRKAKNTLIRCQLMVNLFKTGDSKERYIQQLATMLQCADDYRAIIRVLHSLQALPNLSQNYRHLLLSAAKENPLSQSRAVAEVLRSFEINSFAHDSLPQIT